MIVDKGTSDVEFLVLRLSKVEAATLTVALEGFARQVGMVRAARQAAGLVDGQDSSVVALARRAHEMALLVDRYLTSEPIEGVKET